jgi:hypothetical protein
VISKTVWHYHILEKLGGGSNPLPERPWLPLPSSGPGGLLAGASDLVPVLLPLSSTGRRQAGALTQDAQGPIESSAIHLPEGITANHGRLH